MPTIAVPLRYLVQALGKEFSDKEIDQLCFDFGLEIDEIAKEDDKGKELPRTEWIYKMEAPANRYDLWSAEGISEALAVYCGTHKVAPKYEVTHASSPLQLTIDPSVKRVRPFCVAAILRNVEFNETRFASFIELQEKLNHNLGRRRALVSIGTHDLDSVRPPFRYTMLNASQTRFVPLNRTQEFSALELRSEYERDAHLKPYLSLLDRCALLNDAQKQEADAGKLDFAKVAEAQRDTIDYPFILDADGLHMSMPPVINSTHSRVTLATRNVFIEITATDRERALAALDTMCCAFARYSNDAITSGDTRRFFVEPVEIIDGSLTEHTPKLAYSRMPLDIAYCVRSLGVPLTSSDIVPLLAKMSLECDTPAPESDGHLNVIVPPTRHDILHACDLMEDVGIAYGYNNLPKTIPATSTFGSQFPLNKLSDQLRIELANAGWCEALTFSLCSVEDVSTNLNRAADEELLRDAVRISNPATIDFQVVRTSLLPGLLKTLASNKRLPLPLKVFEVHDVVVKDSSRDTGARNERRIAAVSMNKQAGLEVIHGLLDRVMQTLSVAYASSATPTIGYRLEATNCGTYLPGRCVSVIANGRSIGLLGVLHPNVLEKFELSMPCSAFEINIESFL